MQQPWEQAAQDLHANLHKHTHLQIHRPGGSAHRMGHPPTQHAQVRFLGRHYVRVQRFGPEPRHLQLLLGHPFLPKPDKISIYCDMLNVYASYCNRQIPLRTAITPTGERLRK